MTSDEPGRLATLRRLGLVGTAPEPAYDRLVRLATSLVDVPIAWISLIEADRSWFKARVGLELGETSSEASFCAHTIRHDDGNGFIVPDTWVDEFENNPLVIGSPRIRFYAGWALRTPDGQPVGTLSVVDRAPHTLTVREHLALSDLASLAEELFAARLAESSRSEDSDRADIAASHTVPALGPSIDGADLLRLEAAEVMLGHTSDVIVVLDANGQIKFASPSFSKQLGHVPDAQQEPLFFVDTKDRGVARSRITGAMAGDPTAEAADDRFNIRVTTASGSMRNMECSAQSLFSTPSVGGVVLIMRDVSDRHLLSQMLAFQSTHDRLTELPNRMLFQEHLSPALARSGRDGRPIAVVCLDVDGFHELNEHLGHAAGDELLVDVAKRIRSLIRNGDSAARLSGESFAVLLDPVTDAVEAQRVAQRLVAAVSGPHSLRAGVSDCGAHAGIAMASPGDDAVTILARAARAVSNAKRGERGNVVVAPADGQLAGLPAERD